MTEPLQNHDFVVQENDDLRRLDKFLASQISDISRNVLVKFLEQGCAQVNGVNTGKSYKVKTGDKVHITIPISEPDSDIVAVPMTIEIAYRDDDIAVVNKRAGVCVHPAPGHIDDTLVNGMLDMFPQMAFIGSLKRPGVIHRLDLDTSGLIIFALSPTAYHRLCNAIKERQIERRYIAIVHGVPADKRVKINIPIGRDPHLRRNFTTKIKPGTGKSAQTEFEVAQEFHSASLLNVKLGSGRTHQIRVHLKHFGNPVIGDSVYGKNNAPFPIKRQALHAHTLKFDHPITGERLELEEPLPNDMIELLDFLNNA
ncbi:MAG: RluA family pseudouridine synthase [Candidatus Lindowbacteria bacterium]|nr:RluA family pseudouridine synthase [Candidatus Lindowbacteria bacterium]